MILLIRKFSKSLISSSANEIGCSIGIKVKLVVTTGNITAIIFLTTLPLNSKPTKIVILLNIYGANKYAYSA